MESELGTRALQAASKRTHETLQSLRPGHARTPAAQGGNGAGQVGDTGTQLPSPPRSPNPVPRPGPDMLNGGKSVPVPGPDGSHGEQRGDGRRGAARARARARVRPAARGAARGRVEPLREGSTRKARESRLKRRPDATSRAVTRQPLATPTHGPTSISGGVFYFAAADGVGVGVGFGRSSSGGGAPPPPHPLQPALPRRRPELQLQGARGLLAGVRHLVQRDGEAHPFDSSKWGRMRNFLEDEGLLQSDRIVEPLEASEEDLLVVHSESYLNSLKSSESIVKVPAVALLPNLLVQQKLLYPFRKQVGGSVLSAKLALEKGWAINIGGGFHHCSAQEGSGFCAYADISLCIHFAFVRLNISRVMIIDLDAHQGNGHEKDFGSDGRVYTLDMYNSGIYPFGGVYPPEGFICIAIESSGSDMPSFVAQDHVVKKYIDQKVELDSGAKTEDYLEILDKALKVAESRFHPQLIVYNAGTDILDGDPLGRLKVSPEGVTIRDEKVFRFAKDRNIPLLMLTSGGYMKSSRFYYQPIEEKPDRYRYPLYRS